MSNLFRIRTLGFVTIVCTFSIVWFAVSPRNTILVSEILDSFQQFVPDDHITRNQDVDNRIVRDSAMFGFILSDKKTLVQDVPTSEQPPSLPPYVEGDALKELRICANKLGSGWSFNCKIQCANQSSIIPETFTLMKIKVQCNTQSLEKVADANVSVPVYSFTDSCFRDTLYHQCLDGEAVPNIVHYIFFGMDKLSFFHFLSIWSIHTIQKPCVILVHGDTQLSGPYWTYLVRAIPNIIRVRRTPPRHIFGIPIKLVEHKADVARLEAVRDYGGIYMDADEVLLRSLDPLRKYNFTLSHAFDYNLSNGLIMSSRNASFVNLWYQKYKTYDGVVWGHHSTIVPYKLSQRYPHLIHIETKTFVNPDFDHVNMIFKENFNWSNNYAIHLYIRKYELEHNFTDIRHLNTTIGSVARHILYGHKDLCSE